MTSAPVDRPLPHGDPATDVPATETPRPPGGGRDRYLDLLRALALVRVIVYHTFGWAWLTLLFPSMGVMFALAGSLMARSLGRPALSVIRARLRRLLPPLWIFAAVALTAMFVQGWQPQGEDGSWGWARLLCWIVPVGSPPFPEHLGSASGWTEDTWAQQAAGPLWYLRTYLWFVVLSPLLLRAFRRFPLATLVAPLAVAAVVGTGLLTIPGETGETVTDIAVYGACWIAGFAHHDGVLARLPGYVIPSLAPVAMAVGFWWASGHLGEDGWDLNDIPLAQALWSFGFVLLLLHLSPAWQALPGRLRLLEAPVTLLNSRAVTVYLWHEVALLASVPLIDQLWNVPLLEERVPWVLDSTWFQFAVIWPLLALLVVCFGWVEDLAAKRRPRLFPWPRKSAEL